MWIFENAVCWRCVISTLETNLILNAWANSAGVGNNDDVCGKRHWAERLTVLNQFGYFHYLFASNSYSVYHLHFVCAIIARHSTVEHLRPPFNLCTLHGQDILLFCCNIYSSTQDSWALTSTENVWCAHELICYARVGIQQPLRTFSIDSVSWSASV